MKATIQVRDRREAFYLRAALDDKPVRAFVLTMGILRTELGTDEDRLRVLAFVRDFYASRQPALPFDELRAAETVSPS